MRLHKYLRPESILLDLPAPSRETVLRTFADHFAELHETDSAADLAERLIARERVHTTALGEGVAVPHATSDSLEDPELLIGITSEPIQFGPESTDPVRVFFVLVSPPGRANHHIKLLARICRLVRHEGFIDELQSAETREEAMAVVERVDAEHV